MGTYLSEVRAADVPAQVPAEIGEISFYGAETYFRIFYHSLTGSFGTYPRERFGACAVRDRRNRHAVDYFKGKAVVPVRAVVLVFFSAYRSRRHGKTCRSRKAAYRLGIRLGTFGYGLVLPHSGGMSGNVAVGKLFLADCNSIVRNVRSFSVFLSILLQSFLFRLGWSCGHCFRSIVYVIIFH